MSEFMATIFREASEAADEECLEKLLLDQEFISLSTDQAFSVFEAMGMAKAEIRHLHFLRHLLDPLESHGLGDRFLRSFLTRVCSTHASFRIADVLLSDFDDVRVVTEQSNIDVLITCPAMHRSMPVLHAQGVNASDGGDALRCIGA